MSEIQLIQKPESWIPVNLENGHLFVSANQATGVVRLSQQDGHLMQLDNGEWGISAEGYRACNLIAGIPCITPDTMKLPDGREVCNPYVEFDPMTGTADKFWSHKITIGKGPSGNIIVSSATVLFDVRIRFVKELARKIESNRDAGKLCMTGTLSEEEERSGIFMPFQSNLGIYGRQDNPDVIQVIQNLITNKEHGDKIVQTLAWKASIKQQPCMPLSKLKVLNGFANVLIVGYRMDFDEQQLKAIANEFKETGNVEGAEVVEMIGSVEEVGGFDDDSLLSSEGGPRF